MENEERYKESEPFYHAGPGKGRHRTDASSLEKICLERGWGLKEKKPSRFVSMIGTLLMKLDDI